MKRCHLVAAAVNTAKAAHVVTRDETTALLRIALERVGPNFVQEEGRNRNRRELPIDLNAAAHRGHVSDGSEACYQLVPSKETPWQGRRRPTRRSASA